MTLFKDEPKCKNEFEKGELIEEWETGDTECQAVSYRYECGGVYNHNYMDVVGCRDHDCFWDCTRCKMENRQ